MAYRILPQASASAKPGKNEAPRTGLRETGAGKGTRTLDPDLGKVVLYQLSYSRVLLNFAFVIFAFLRRYGRRIIREIFPSATPLKNFF